MCDTVAPEATDANGIPVQCLPGLSGGEPNRHAASLTGHTVVHLHGALTPASYDGWAENIFAPGQTAVFHYPMDQRAALLWYHDHVMGITKFNVYAGLAGLWIVRDERERELGLARGAAVRGAATDSGPQLRRRRAGEADRAARSQDRPGGDGGLPAVHGRERQGLAGARRPAGDLPLPRAERLQRPHLPARPGARRRTGARPDHADRDRPRAPPYRGAHAGGRTRARLGRARRPARGLLRPRSREPSSRCSTPPPPRSTAPRSPPQTAENAADLERPAPVPAGAALPCRRRGGQPPCRFPASSRPTTTRRRRTPWPTRLAVRSRSSSASSTTSRTCSRCASSRSPTTTDDGPVVTVDRRRRRPRAIASSPPTSRTRRPSSRCSAQHEVWQLINLTGDTHPIHLHLDPFQILARRPIRYEIPDGGIGDRALAADRHARARPGRRARPRDRRQRTRPQGHDSRQPQRDRRNRRPLHHLQRPVHVPLPHPRARRPRHDAAVRDDAARAHAVHGLTGRRRRAGLSALRAGVQY